MWSAGAGGLLQADTELMRVLEAHTYTAVADARKKKKKKNASNKRSENGHSVGDSGNDSDSDSGSSEYTSESGGDGSGSCSSDNDDDEEEEEEALEWGGKPQLKMKHPKLEPPKAEAATVTVTVVSYGWSSREHVHAAVTAQRVARGYLARKKLQVGAYHRYWCLLVLHCFYVSAA
jgi:hypothetical protein